VCIPHVEGLENRFQLVLVIDFHGTVDVNIASQELKVENIGNILPELAGDFAAHSA
jgi:hypothetical protein